ncbi:glycoside hydrolase family 13 protein [Clostridium weizhouense]|uniref:Glycoside hydrolase family 13 protein n=1 Tax=Clostridium weizhouense TaxID=2859781 RepID=A0ABS7ATB2_9CLOT|nr:glycoside hydrolase family 13 protein [Clostridium weizhouense]MBW6411923.1 glycoside hydrolase family 13 protein [Clostridium weizhouense]
MNDIKVVYNSQDKNFRKPFGAVELGQKVKLSIVVNKDLMVAIEIINFNGDSSQIGMQKEYLNNGDYKYSAKIDTSKSIGILQYYFILIDGYRRIYYGNNDEKLGGEGQLYINDPVPYQITVYEKCNIPNWYKEGIVYQIFVDRFFNGNDDKKINFPKKNSFIYATWDDEPMYIKDNMGRVLRWDFYGGNLKGILKKLDYIKSLGANIIYLSPIFKSASCHKYDVGDYEIVDEMFGSNDEFHNLCKVADLKGIKIILDGVFSNTGSDSKYFNKLGNYDEIGAYQSPNSKYYNWFKFINYPYQYESWWGLENRPNVNELEESYLDYIVNKKNSIIEKWMNLGASGWRLNVADELPDKFIRLIKKKMNSINNDNILIGEVWEDASNKISYSKKREYLFGRELDSVTNYPLRECLINFVKGYIKSSKFKKKIMCLYENYPRENFYANMNIIGTHDTERILTVLDKKLDLLKLIIVLQMTLPGVPVIYYGDEAGLEGGKDPECRKPYPWGKENDKIIKFYQKITEIRNNEDILKKGNLKIYDTTDEICIYERRYEENSIVIIVNNSFSDKPIKCPEIEGEYMDLFRNKKINITTNSTLSAYEFYILGEI